jgi:hypothetical protein
MNQRLLRVAPAFAVALVAAVLAPVAGCGTTCPDIQRRFEAFDRTLDQRVATRGSERGPDARLDLPLPVLNRFIAATIATRGPRRVPMPALTLPGAAPIPVDGLFWSLRSVEVIAGPGGRLGATVRLEVSDADTTVAEFRLETHIQTVFSNTRDGRITRASWRLSGADIQRIEPTVSDAGRRRLGAWLTEQLPTALRFIARDEVIDATLPLLLELLTDEAWPTVRDAVLGKEALIDLGIDLPDWPIGRVKLETTPPSGATPGVMSLWLTSTFEGTSAIATDNRTSRANARAEMVLTGPLAARLTAVAMRDGTLPGRFDREGKPASDGVWHARPLWHGGARPFGARLWRFDARCREVTVDAELALATEGGELAVTVREARVMGVRGDGLLEAFAWAERIFGDALDLTLKRPATTLLTLADDAFHLGIAQAEVRGDLLRFELELRPGATPSQ